MCVFLVFFPLVEVLFQLLPLRFTWLLKHPTKRDHKKVNMSVFFPRDFEIMYFDQCCLDHSVNQSFNYSCVKSFQYSLVNNRRGVLHSPSLPISLIYCRVSTLLVCFQLGGAGGCGLLAADFSLRVTQTSVKPS